MIINRIAGAIKNTLNIQTKAEKKIQRELQQTLQASADKLKGENHDLFVKNIDGKINHLKVSDDEITQINKDYATRSQKVGIPRLDDPNHDKHGLEQFNDIWNPRYTE